MPTARESRGRLVIDFGDGAAFTIPPMRGKHGKTALDILLGITFGHTRNDEGQEAENAATERLRRMVLCLDGFTGWMRERRFQALRATQQQTVSQAAILWNVQGGSLDAVLDLLDEAGGGYPKGLGRVMRSCGLDAQYELLRTWLDSVANLSATASTPNPTGGLSTSASSEKTPTG